MQWSSYPLNVEASGPARLPRWRPLVNWALVLPAFLWLLLLRLGALVVAFLGWWTIVLYGRLPDSWGDYQMGALRYGWRVSAYLHGWSDRYPGFSVPAGYIDPGDQPAVLYCAKPGARKRLGALLRGVMAAPHLALLLPVMAAQVLALAAGWLAVVLAGRWPTGVRRFAIGAACWRLRVEAYTALVSDAFPPFGAAG